MKSLDAKIKKYFEKYKISSHDEASKEYFIAAVNIALNEYKLPALYLAEEFEVAKSTVNRWATGTAVPHPRLRKLILEYIAEKI